MHITAVIHCSSNLGSPSRARKEESPQNGTHAWILWFLGWWSPPKGPQPAVFSHYTVVVPSFSLLPTLCVEELNEPLSPFFINFFMVTFYLLLPVVSLVLE